MMRTRKHMNQANARIDDSGADNGSRDNNDNKPMSNHETRQ